MSESDLLYVRRNMNISESEVEENETDIWDDSKLNDAYDKALNIANAEVAKRLAMSTNTVTKDGSKSKKPLEHPAPHRSEKKDRAKWRAGMHCRAVYEEDGIEYEALVMRIINEKECVVRFLGYENSEIVPISSLKNSLGKGERNQQIQEALGEECYSVRSHTVEEMDCSDLPCSPDSMASSKKKKAKKNKNRKPSNGFILTDLPSMHNMPSFAHLKNLTATDMPMPPPPPLNLPRQETECEDQAVSSMLLSWYMSGYYTGLYQGMKRAREGRKHQ